jgi:hypothetical protein
MGVMLVGLMLAAAGAGVPADGHTVVPLSKAKADTELVCDGALQGAFLTPASAKTFGVRAPVKPGTVACMLKPTKGKPVAVPLKFLEPKWPLSVGATAPVVLGVDGEALLEVRGKALRADGSAGSATLEGGKVHAALPTSKMPQNLVVLVEGEKGGAAYAVVPLLGRATMKVQTSKDAKVEAVVAGHRSTGFTSDASGTVALQVPAPVGFLKGQIDVTDANAKTSHAAITLAAAKPLFALAALGPADNVAPGAVAELLVAGADPLGLPPKPKELKATASAGKVKGLALLQPGLWKVQVVAPASGEVTVDLALGNASRKLSFAVGAPTPKPEPKPAVEAKPEPAPEAKPAVAEAKPEPAPEPKAEPKPEVKPAVAEAPKPPPEPRPQAIPEPPKPAVEVAAKPVHKPSSDDEEGFRLELLVEGGYLTNGGALEGLAPGGQVQLAYRTGDFDLGLSVDALFAQASHDGSVSVDGATVTTSTTASTLQVLAGPWVRYRFTDWLGVDLTAGAGVARTTEQIDSGTTTNASGTTSPLALGGMAGLDFNFGLVRAFAGARYLTASASGDLSGNAGGLAVLGGVGVDLGL